MKHDRICFPGQHNGEHVQLLLRRHWFTFFATTVFFLLLLFFPLFFRLLIPITLWTFLQGSAWQTLVLLFLSAYYLFLWLFFFTAFVDYYLDVWILTDERIVNIEQEGLFHRVISEQRILRVQDVTSDVKGVLPTFLNYGNVYVQTAGERERFMFEQVYNPQAVEKTILQLHERALTRLSPTERGNLAAVGEEFDMTHRPPSR